MPDTPDQKKLQIHLIVRNRDKIFFDEDVKAITSINHTGKFDILAEHANFISIIQEYIIVHRLDDTKEKMEINNGVVKVSNQLINCYVDIIPPQLIPRPPAPEKPPEK